MNSSNLKINHLEEWIKIADIPKSKPVSKNLFQIGSFGHLENIVRNFYHYYLDPDEDHGLGTLFFDSLLELIKVHKPEFEWTKEYLSVQKEFVLKDKKRIDLIITNHSEMDKVSKCIVMEMKMYHYVSNDFDAYIDAVQTKRYKDKIGVLLCPYPTEEKYHKSFINLTHQDFLKRVKSNLLNFTPENRHQVILEEWFAEFIDNGKQEKDEMEKLDFYLKHKEKVDEISRLRIEFFKKLNLEISNLGAQSEGKNNWSLVLPGKKFKIWYLVDDSFEDHFLISYIGITGTRVKKRIQAFQKGRNFGAAKYNFLEKYYEDMEGGWFAQRLYKNTEGRILKDFVGLQVPKDFEKVMIEFENFEME